MAKAKPKTDTGMTPKPTPSSDLVFFFRVDGLGPVPAFKNGKNVRGRGRRKFPATDPKKKRWMKSAILILRGQIPLARMPRHLRQPRLPNRTKDRIKRISEELSKAATVRVLIGISSLGSSDSDGALATIMDCLEAATIIPEDAPRYVASSSASLVPAESGEEFASITITYRP